MKNNLLRSDLLGRIVNMIGLTLKLYSINYKFIL